MVTHVVALPGQLCARDVEEVLDEEAVGDQACHGEDHLKVCNVTVNALRYTRVLCVRVCE